MRRIQWLMLLALAPHALLCAGSESAYEQASRVDLRTVEDAMQVARERMQVEGARQSAASVGTRATLARQRARVVVEAVKAPPVGVEPKVGVAPPAKIVEASVVGRTRERQSAAPPSVAARPVEIPAAPAIAEEAPEPPPSVASMPGLLLGADTPATPIVPVPPVVAVAPPAAPVVVASAAAPAAPASAAPELPATLATKRAPPLVVVAPKLANVATPAPGPGVASDDDADRRTALARLSLVERAAGREEDVPAAIPVADPRRPVALAAPRRAEPVAKRVATAHTRPSELARRSTRRRREVVAPRVVAPILASTATVSAAEPKPVAAVVPERAAEPRRRRASRGSIADEDADESLTSLEQGAERARGRAEEARAEARIERERMRSEQRPQARTIAALLNMPNRSWALSRAAALAQEDDRPEAEDQPRLRRVIVTRYVPSYGAPMAPRNRFSGRLADVQRGIEAHGPPSGSHLGRAAEEMERSREAAEQGSDEMAELSLRRAEVLLRASRR